MEGVTCTACRISLPTQEEAKVHYKSEFHTYNLKRKLVQLAPVSLEVFTEKKQSSAKLQSPAAVEIKCALCNAIFRVQEKFDKHMASHTDNPQKKPELPFSPEATCLFCNKTDVEIAENLKHMMISHGFFIPDVEFVNDLNLFMTYLHERVRIGLLCLYCNNKGTHQFRDFQSLQQHMVDKQHCFLNTEEDAEEYIEFYSYPKEECNIVARGNMEITDTGELKLENGSLIGTKEYRKYYKQYYRPRNQRHADVLAIMAEEYKTLAVSTSWNVTDDSTGRQANNQRRDLQQGLKNNMLKHYFRKRDPM